MFKIFSTASAALVQILLSAIWLVLLKSLANPQTNKLVAVLIYTFIEEMFTNSKCICLDRDQYRFYSSRETIRRGPETRPPVFSQSRDLFTFLISESITLVRPQRQNYLRKPYNYKKKKYKLRPVRSECINSYTTRTTRTIVYSYTLSCS